LNGNGNCVTIDVDLDNDGDVDINDLGIATVSFGLTSNDNGWVEATDVVSDDEINIFDVVMVASMFS
jgi:hypothetical protein